ncbi:MAG: hypothetical protein VST70_03240, partial [Nitrospirota bacterium]|nr:hypothetical protein [Nitrospirota bacterium]
HSGGHGRGGARKFPWKAENPEGGHVVSSGNLPEPGERIVARTAGLSLGLRLEESCPEVPPNSKS